MAGSSTSQDQSVFPIMRLPLELRRKIYTFATIGLHPMELRINYYGGGPRDTPTLSRARLYTDDDVRMLATSHEFRKEISDVMYAEITFDISLCREDPGRGVCMHQIDLRRIKKCRLILHDVETCTYQPNFVFWGGPLPHNWHHHLIALVATLFLNGHQMEIVLVECQSQNAAWLLECLRPMAMLRRVGSIHFRSNLQHVWPHCRILEATIMSDAPVPFTNWHQLRDQAQPRSHLDRGRNPPPRSTDIPNRSLVAISEAEREATAKTFYERLGIAGEMKPLQYL